MIRTFSALTTHDVVFALVTERFTDNMENEWRFAEGQGKKWSGFEMGLRRPYQLWREKPTKLTSPDTDSGQSLIRERRNGTLGATSAAFTHHRVKF
jgi:hypothetical protein